MDGTTNKVNKVPMNMPPTSTRPMEFRAAAPAPVTSVSGKWPAIVAAVVIRIGLRRIMAESRIASSLECPCELQVVGKFNNQDAVLGHQTHQGYQADLGVDIERGGPAAGPELEHWDPAFSGT